MKKYMLLLLFILLISCDSKFYKYDPQKIIGTHISTLHHIDWGIQGSTYIDDIHYYVTGAAFNKKKAIMYVYNDDGYCIDFYFTKFINSNNVLNFPKETSNLHILKKLGRPALITKNIYNNYHDEYIIPYAFYYTYLYLYPAYLYFSPDDLGISSILEIEFDDNGKLINCFKGRLAP